MTLKSLMCGGLFCLALCCHGASAAEGCSALAVSWLMSIPRSARRSSTLRNDSGYLMYIITARRITSGELLKYRNGLRMALRALSREVNLAARNWKSQYWLTPRWRLAASGTLLLGGHGACGGR